MYLYLSILFQALSTNRKDPATPPTHLEIDGYTITPFSIGIQYHNTLLGKEEHELQHPGTKGYNPKVKITRLLIDCSCHSLHRYTHTDFNRTLHTQALHKALLTVSLCFLTCQAIVFSLISLCIICFCLLCVLILI